MNVTRTIPAPQLEGAGMSHLIRRIQLRARIQDWFDERAGRGWFAPPGTYDGSRHGRPFRHLRCHYCGGKHHAGRGECRQAIR